jgi:hypothetical protein
MINTQLAVILSEAKNLNLGLAEISDSSLRSE